MVICESYCQSGVIIMATIIDLMVERIWKVARRIIFSWNEQATEIFILDLPLQDLPRILDTLIAVTREPAVMRSDGKSLNEAWPLTKPVRHTLIACSEHNTVHSLRAWVSNRSTCYFYLWINAETQRMEIEMVFWNDFSFPAGLPMAEHKRMLGRLLRIAQQLRGDNHQSKCILSREYNSEPRELLKGHMHQVAIW